MEILEYVVRIVLACICGAAIGIERTVRLKEAGIRTHTIVALGSALVMVVSKYGFDDVMRIGGSYDASRIAASVVTGISFLGAGVIFVRGSSIRGLTTSAGIWATSGIGLSLGAGMYSVGIASTVLLVLVQILLHKFVGGLDSMSVSDISITAVYSADILLNLRALLESHGMSIQKCNAMKEEENLITFNLTVKTENDEPFGDMMEIFEHNENIVSFSM